MKTPIKYVEISFLYLMGIGLIFLFNFNKSDSVVGILFTSIISIPFYLFLLRETSFLAEYGLPLLIYLIMSLLRIGIVGLYVAFIFSQGDGFSLAPIFEDGFGVIYFGSLVLVIGDFVFVVTSLVNVYMRHHKGITNKFLKTPVNHELICKNGVLLLALSIFLGYSDQFLNFGAYGQLFSIFIQYSGPGGLLLLAIYKIKKNRLPIKVRIFIYIFLAMKIPIVITSFWKQEMILYLLPLSYLGYFRIINNRKRRVFYAFLYGGMGIITIVLLFNYSMLTRNQLLKGIDINPYTMGLGLLSEAVTSSIPFSDTFRELNQFPRQGIWAILARSESYTGSAWVYNNVAYNGYRSDILDIIKKGFMPRLLFPEKEPITLGKELAVELKQALDVESATTSTAYGMFPAYFRNYGWIGVVFGAVISSFCYAFLVNYSSRRYLNNPIMALVYFSLIVESIRWFESAFDGGILFFALLYLQFIPLSFMYEKLFLNKAILRQIL